MASTHASIVQSCRGQAAEQINYTRRQKFTASSTAVGHSRPLLRRQGWKKRAHFKGIGRLKRAARPAVAMAVRLLGMAVSPWPVRLIPSTAV